jgi:hypothetical protein
MAIAKLSAEVTVAWECPRGHDHDATVDVVYTFDGDRNVNILEQRVAWGEPEGIGDWEFDQLVFDAISDRAWDDYSEWYADQVDVARG